MMKINREVKKNMHRMKQPNACQLNETYDEIETRMKIKLASTIHALGILRRMAESNNYAATFVFFAW